MSDEVISAPGGGAAVATPSAPAPSAPVSSPAPASPAAPTAAPVSSEVPSRNVGESDIAYLGRTSDWRSKQTGDEPVEAPKPAEPVKVEEPKPVEPPKPAEPPKVEEPKPAEPVKNPLDEIGPLPASKLAEALAKNPELEGALEAAGIGKEELFAGLREAAQFSKFREMGLPDVETAQAAVTAATQLYGLDSAATELKPGDMESTAGFVSKLMEMSYLLDDDGKPKMQKLADGREVPQTDGTVSTLLDNLVDLRLEEVLSQATKLTESKNDQAIALGERVMAAVHEARQFIKGVEPDAEGQPEEIKAQRASLDADRAAFAKTKTDEANQRFETFKGDVLKATNETLDGLIGGVLGQSSLAPDANDTPQVKEQKDFIRNGVLREIRDGLYAKFNASQLFKAEQEQIGRRGASAGTQKALVNLYNRYANAALESVARPILTKAGAVRVEASKAKAAKIATQVKESRTEPRGTTAAVAPTTPKIDQAELTRTAYSQLVAEKGRMPSSAEVMERTRALIAKAGTAPTV